MLGGVEKHLLQVARQIAAPYQARRRGQRAVVDLDTDHVIAVGLLVGGRPAPPGGAGSGQHRGGAAAGAANARVIGSECRNGGSVNAKLGLAARITASQAS